VERQLKVHVPVYNLPAGRVYVETKLKLKSHSISIKQSEDKQHVYKIKVCTKH